MGGGGRGKQAAADAYPRLAPGPVGQWIPNIYISRINQFTSKGQWEKQNLLA
jgi:alpha-mannosidase